MTNLKAAAIIGGNLSTRKRQINDWYPTPEDVTKSFLEYIDVSSIDAWEPCAGDGSMLDVIKNYTNCIGTDLSPQRSDINTHDFLSDIPDNISKDSIIITNPPFNIADKIIKHTFESGFTKLALVLKSTYFHASSRTTLFETYRPTKVLPLNWRPDFLGLGSPTMEVSWFYWEEPCAKACEYDILKKIKS